MFGLLFRIIGFCVLALALVLAVLDVTRSITAGTLVLTSLAQWWAVISPETLLSGQQTLSETIHPFLWDPVIVTLLQLPSWLICWVISMLLLWMGQKREARYGRFASR